MREAIEAIRAKAQTAIENASTPEELEGIRINFLGKKGELTAVLRGMGSLSPEERPVVGQLANDVRAKIEEAISKASESLKEKKLEEQLKQEKLDVTMPAEQISVGHHHPLSLVQRRLEDIFIGMGLVHRKLERYKHLYDRFSEILKFETFGVNDLSQIFNQLSEVTFTPDAIEYFHSKFNRFRQIVQLINQIETFAKDNNLTEITKEIMEQII